MSLEEIIRIKKKECINNIYIKDHYEMIYSINYFDKRKYLMWLYFGEQSINGNIEKYKNKLY